MYHPYSNLRHNSPTRPFAHHTSPRSHINRPQQYNPRQSNPFHQPRQETQSHSRISQLNDRLTMETEMIRRRNQAKRGTFDVRSSSSEMRRSRASADRRRRERQLMEYGNNRGINNQPLRYQSETQSLQSSRASQQLLSRPIISYSDIREPFVLSTNNNNNNNDTQFRRQKPSPHTEVVNRPILKKVQGPVHYMKSEESQAVPYFRTSGYSDPQRRDYDQMKNEQFEQFLDMDFNKKPSALSSHSRDFLQQQQPVSPVTPHTPTIPKRESYKMEAPTLQTSIRSNTPAPVAVPFTKRVTGMVGAVDYDGKIVTGILVGLGVLLVLFQLLR